MQHSKNVIPVEPLAEKFETGIAIGKFSFNDLRLFQEADHSHRHDYHLFLFQETGTADFEIDFERFKTNNNTLFYIHPNQVHRIVKVKDAVFYLLAINNEKINPTYNSILEEISPTKPLTLSTEKSSLLYESIALCEKIFEDKSNKIYTQLLRDGSNTLVALILSQFLESAKSVDKITRHDVVTKSFKYTLEHNFKQIKSPSAYAKHLNLSTPYLNECVRNSTGYSVSHHIQHRIVLEAKRLLYHSDKSVKEIASELGYDDSAYFSRVFTKTAKISAKAFKAKNFD